MDRRLIEDIVKAKWNQGDVYRLESCEAICDDENFIILFKESKEPTILG